MCLANTTPIWLIIYSVVSKDEANPSIGVLVGALFSILGTVICALPQSEEARVITSGRITRTNSWAQSSPCWGASEGQRT